MRLEFMQKTKMKQEKKEQMERVVSRIDFDEMQRRSVEAVKKMSSSNLLQGTPLTKFADLLRQRKTLQSPNPSLPMSNQTNPNLLSPNQHASSTATPQIFNFKEILQEEPTSELQQHRDKIETIKNTMMQSFGKEPVDKNRVEERIQETKKQILDEQVEPFDSGETPEEQEFGYDSDRQKQQDTFSHQLRQSLIKLRGNLDEEGRVNRQNTEKEQPVASGNELTVGTKESDNSHNFNFNLANDVDSDVQQLAANITQCLQSILNTKMLINEYSSMFETTLKDLGEDANEIIKQHYAQGRNCMESYLTIMALIEKLLRDIDLQNMSSRISNLHTTCNENEKRFYYVENRVKTIQEILARKIRALEKAQARVLQKPLVIVRRNPLLDTRDEKHSKYNIKIIDKSPTNL